MTRFFLRLTIGALLSLSSCMQPAKKTDEGKIRGHNYSSKEIGWTIKIPQGWEVLDLKKVREADKKGVKAMEKVINRKIDYHTIRNLISFQSNPYNIFRSNSKPFNMKYKEEWEDSLGKMKRIIYDTYQNLGITIDTSETTIKRIDGLDFYRYDFIIFDPKGKATLKQINYCRLINGFSFGVSISYNNEKDKNEMLKAFKESTFH
ncbi:hypothetical protein [Fluviicola sp.]|uniref:hypothetical protein n=1 Tax=Fluviicola sp. TaxID=1917219 RepID=UPI0031CE6925